MCLYDYLYTNYNNYWLEKIYLESDNIINQLNSISFREKLGIELFKFLSIISNKDYNNYSNFMEILLNKTDFIKLYKDPKIRYIVINYFKRKKFHELDFELSSINSFVKTIIYYLYGVDQKIEIPFLKEKEWEQTYNDELESVYTIPLCPHSLLNKEKYNFFDNRYNESVETFKTLYEGSFSNLKGFTMEEIMMNFEQSYSWIYSEYLSHRFFYKYLNKNIVKLCDIKKNHDEQYNINRWVSKYDGDGYGFDHLFIGDYFNIGDKKEIGVETKKRYVNTSNLSESEIEEKRFKDFNLTYTEHQKMRYSNMDYFVFLYSIIENNGINYFKSKLLYYDRNINLLYDINKNDDLYDIDENNQFKIISKEKKIMITNNFNY